MTVEELEKTVQFILEQQAQFAANQQQVGERVSRLETNMAEMARAQTHTNEVVAVMVDTHRHTEEKLDAFIGVLERYISEGRNDKGSGDAD
jgi:3-phenylpropionate/cinnamic acid dioxygenase small subunit